MRAMSAQGSRAVGVDPGRAAVVEVAIATVAAGRAGRFRLTIGGDRGAGEGAPLGTGADVVSLDRSEHAMGTARP